MAVRFSIRAETVMNSTAVVSVILPSRIDPLICRIVAMIEVPPTGHESVMLGEVLAYLNPQPGQIMMDCTVGRGGHSLALAQRLGQGGTLIGLDVDPRNLEYAQARLRGLACNVRLFHANFAEIADVLAEAKVGRVDGILADLGLSTNQFLDPQYGLSFSSDGPLDMRLDPRLCRTAAEVVNTLREEDLADLFFELAQERYSRRIARKIVEARRICPITTTGRLAELVRSAIPPRGGAPEKIDPATRTFLALRMHVNQEMEQLGTFLQAVGGLLAVGGSQAVISFQSMEDRLVKQAFRAAEQAGGFKILTKKPLVPGDAELQRNPRSRSAKMRVIRRVA